jgi:hypothetical protein
MASGAQIRASRVLLGWTPRDLAHMANVCVFTVNQIERIEGPGAWLAFCNGPRTVERRNTSARKRRSSGGTNVP